MFSFNHPPLHRNLWLALAAIVSFACGREHKSSTDRALAPPPEQSAPEASSPDRLPPDELLAGEEEAFGFVFPIDMQVTRTRKSAKAVGRVPFNDLTDYVRARIAVRHAEMLNGRLVFPNARIHGGDPEQVFELTLVDQSKQVTLLIQDKTPLPPTSGLTEEQRWLEVGMRPGGGLVDPHGME